MHRWTIGHWGTRCCHAVLMASEELLAQWSRARVHLLRARGLLPDGENQLAGPDLLAEYLDCNELGLAADVLAEAGERLMAGADFWRAMSEALDEMQVDVADPVHGVTRSLVNQHLSR